MISLRLRYLSALFLALALLVNSSCASLRQEEDVAPRLEIAQKTPEDFPLLFDVRIPDSQLTLWGGHGSPVTGFSTRFYYGFKVRGVLPTQSIIEELYPERFEVYLIPSNLTELGRFLEAYEQSIEEDTLSIYFEQVSNHLLYWETSDGKSKTFFVFDKAAEELRSAKVTPGRVLAPDFVWKLADLVLDREEINVAVILNERRWVTIQDSAENYERFAEFYEDFTVDEISSWIIDLGLNIADRSTVSRVLRENEISVSDLFSTEFLNEVSDRIAVGYAIVISPTYVVGDPSFTLSYSISLFDTERAQQLAISTMSLTAP